MGDLDRVGVLDLLELQVDGARGSVHSVDDGTISTHRHLTEVAGFDALEQWPIVDIQHDIIDTQQIVGRECLSVARHQLRTDMQHVEQRHFCVGIQLLHMDDIFVAVVFDDILLSPNREGTADHKRNRQQYLKTFLCH